MLHVLHGVRRFRGAGSDGGTTWTSGNGVWRAGAGGRSARRTGVLQMELAGADSSKHDRGGVHVHARAK
jgi:hypothetical protein